MILPKFNMRDIGHRIYPDACWYKEGVARRVIRELHGDGPFDAYDLLSKWKEGCDISWGELVRAICCMLPQEVGQKIYDAKRRADLKKDYGDWGVREVTRGRDIWYVGLNQTHFRRTFRRIIRNAAK